MEWLKAWRRSPVRMWKIWVLHKCPDCNSGLAWGQWNDGDLSGRPVCFNRDCKPPARVIYD